MVKQTPILWTVVITLGVHTSIVQRAAGTQSSTTQLIFYNSTTQLPHNSRIVPCGTTVLLECRVTPHQQQIHYQWTCPHPPCDGEYRKIYNNLILIVATATTSGQYKCTPNFHGTTVTATLTVLTLLAQGTLALYNRSKLLLRDTLITDPRQIPNGLVCTTGRSGELGRFRFEGGTTIHGSRQGQSITVQSSQLNQNGRYVCFEGGKEWLFYIYFNNATLPTPQVSTNSSQTATDQQLRLVMTRPESYNSGRFILRYDCGFRGSPIELEYRSVGFSSGSSDVVVRSNRSCFVVGEISRVTVWFVSGRQISSVSAVVNVSSGEEVDSSTVTCPATADTTVASTTNVLSTGVLATNINPTTPDSTSDQEDNTRSDSTEIHTSTNYQATGQKSSISVQGNTPSNEPQTNNLIPLIGGAAGGVILLLVGVLVLIICTIGLVRRRGKRNRITHREHSHYYSTVQEGEQQAHNNTPPPVEQQIDNFNTGGFYDEVEVKVQPTPVTVPPEYQLVDDAGDVVKVQSDSERKDTAVANPENLYAQPDKKLKNNKLEEQDDKEMQKVEVQDPELLYAVVEKPKKKKGKDRKTKEKDDLQQQPGELLYAEVNKPKKKGKKDKKGKAQKEEIAPNEKEATPPSETPIDTGLTYEPSADTDDTQHQQDGEVNTTQPTPSANVEGLYAEVDKTHMITNS